MVKNYFDIILTCNYSPWSAYSGGGQKSVHMLAQHFTMLGLKVVVIYSKAPWNKIKPPPDVKYSVQWAFFFGLKPGISSPLRVLNGISFYYKAKSLSKNQTIIIGNGDESSLLGFLPKKRFFIYTNRYPQFPSYLKSLNWKKLSSKLVIFFREPKFIAIAMAMSKANSIVCTSNYSRKHLCSHFPIPIERISVIYNGIDPFFYEAFSIKKNNQENAKSKGILFFGRLTKAKGVDLLIRAYKHLPATIKNVHPLIIVGTGPYMASIKSFCKSNHLENNVNILPWQDSPSLYNLILNCKIVVLPSREESFGNTIAESLATGKPVITTHSGSIPEIASHYAFYSPLTHVALTKTLIQTLQNNFQESLIDQVKHIKSNFSWEKASLQFLNLCKD